MQKYSELRVWQRAHGVAMEVHRALEDCSRRHGFALPDQLRRAALSVPANIAEGAKLGTSRLYSRHLTIALGSAAEAHYLLVAARELGFITADAAVRLLRDLDAICAMLHSLRRVVRNAAPEAAASTPAS